MKQHYPSQLTYVYTLAEVRYRLRRGQKSVLLFMPDTGRLATVTLSNYRDVAERFKGATNG